ncbi:MAG: tetratricopeptide repeat protein [bacterium]|nr:tetratricopeptide repeat protein [bacterium]
MGELEKTPVRRSAAHELLAVLVLVVATVGAYWGVWNYEFVHWDDWAYVVENAQVRAGLTWQGLSWAFTTDTMALWHPLTWLSHMLDSQVFGAEGAGGAHVTSLGLHVLNGGLLLLLLRSATGSFWRSLFVSLAFALHPLQVESVAWVAERKNVLSTAFWLLGMISYVRYAKTEGRGWYAASIACLALGLMAKPMLVTMPMLLLLLDYWPLQRFDWDALWPGRLRSLVVEKLPMFLLVAVFSLLTLLVQRGVADTQTLPLAHRVSTALTAYLRYIAKTLWPVDLAPLYPNLPGMWAAWQVLGCALLLLAISLAVLMLHRRRYLIVGWLWFVGSLVPVIGIVANGADAHSMADRYMYVPIIGLLIAITWGAVDVLRDSPRGRQIAVISSVALALYWGWQTQAQAVRWRNSVSLYTHTLEVTSDNAVIHNNLGIVTRLGGRLDEALSHFIAASKIDPQDAKFRTNVAGLLHLKGRVDEAIAQYRQILVQTPDDALLHNNLGIALRQRGNPKEALAHFREAVRLDPELPEAHNQLGVALASRGQLREALGEFERAVALRADFADARRNLSRARALLLKEPLDRP